MSDECDHPFTEEELNGDLNAPPADNEPCLFLLPGGRTGVGVKRRGYYLEVGVPGRSAEVLQKAKD